MERINAATQSVQTSTFPDPQRISREVEKFRKKGPEDWKRIVREAFREIARLELVRVKDLFSIRHPRGIMSQEYYSRLINGRILSESGYKRLAEALIFFGKRYPRLQRKAERAIAALHLLVQHYARNSIYPIRDREKFIKVVDMVVHWEVPS